MNTQIVSATKLMDAMYAQAESFSNKGIANTPFSPEMKVAIHELIRNSFLAGWRGGIEFMEQAAVQPPPPAAPEGAQVAVCKGNVVKLASGRKYVAETDHLSPPGASITAVEPHGDDDFSYLCGESYCRCCQ